MKRKKPRRTQVAMIHRSFRLKRNDLTLWEGAARKSGVSLNEFLREAIRTKARSVLYLSPTDRPDLAKEDEARPGATPKGERS